MGVTSPTASPVEPRHDTGPVVVAENSSTAKPTAGNATKPIAPLAPVAPEPRGTVISPEDSAQNLRVMVKVMLESKSRSGSDLSNTFNGDRAVDDHLKLVKTLSDTTLQRLMESEAEQLRKLARVPQVQIPRGLAQIADMDVRASARQLAVAKAKLHAAMEVSPKKGHEAEALRQRLALARHALSLATNTLEKVEADGKSWTDAVAAAVANGDRAEADACTVGLNSAVDVGNQVMRDVEYLTATVLNLEKASQKGKQGQNEAHAEAEELLARAEALQGELRKKHADELADHDQRTADVEAVKTNSEGERRQEEGVKRRHASLEEADRKELRDSIAALVVNAKHDAGAKERDAILAEIRDLN
jgi:hypothetical protein